jgi:beta-phosphoglucomutase
MFDAVIFDWDGTLADTRKAILYSFHKALRQIGADVGNEQIARLIGVGSAETFREILRASNVKFDDELIRRLVETKIQAEIWVSSQTTLFGGAIELLQSLKGKAKLGLASMKNRKIIDHMLQTTKTQGFFEVVITADETTHHKPSPEIFIKTACKLDVKPERCVVVEDSIFGIEAAKAAHMRCVAVAQGAYSAVELGKAKPDIIVHSLGEKDTILRYILG